MIPEEELESRWRRIRGLMDVRRLEALLIYSNAWRRENVFYMSNYQLLGSEALMVLPREGKPTLLISLPWDKDRAYEASWIKDIKASDNLARDCKEVLKRLELSKGRIGLVGAKELMYASTRGRLEKELSEAKLEGATDLINELFMIKSQKEIELMKKAGEIAQIGFER